MTDFSSSNFPLDIPLGVAKQFHVSGTDSDISNEEISSGDNSAPKNSIFGFVDDEKGDKTATCTNELESQTLINALENEKEQSEKLFKVMFDEAEQLRQWQLCKENDIQKLEVQLNYSKATINTLRKALFESQREGEKISQKVLQDQINYRDINKKLALSQEQVALVKAQCETIAQYMETFRGLKAQFKAQNDERVREIEHICEKLDEVNQEHEDQIKRLNELRQYELAQIESEYNAQLQSVENHLANLQDALDQSKATERNLAQERSYLQDQVEKLDALKYHYESEIDEFKMEKHQALEKIESLEGNIRVLEVFHADLIETKKELASKADEARLSKEIITSLQNKLYHDGNAFIKEREDMQIEIDKEKLRYEIISKELGECEQDRDRLTEQLEVMQKELDNKISELISIKREKCELQEELDNFKENLNEKQLEIKELQDTISQKKIDFELEITNLNKSVETLNLKNEDLEGKFRDAENKDYTRSIEITKIESQLNDAVKDKLDLKAEIQDLKHQQESLGNNLEKLTINCKQLEQNKKELENESKQIKLELDSTQYTVKELRSEKDDLDEKVESLTQENNTLKEQISELEENLSNKTESMEILEQELETANSSLKNKIKRDKTYAQANETKIKNLRADLELRSKTIKSLEKDVKTLEEKAKTQTKEIAKLERTVEEKNTELEEKAMEFVKLASETETSSHQNEMLKVEYQTTLKVLEADKAKLVAEKDEMINFYDMKEKNYQRDISKKGTELEEYKKKVFDAERISSQDEMKEGLLNKLRKEKRELEMENQRLVKGRDEKLLKVEEELKNLKKDYEYLKVQNDDNIRQIERQQTEAKKVELQMKNFNLRNEVAKLTMQKPKNISQVFSSNAVGRVDSISKLSSKVKEPQPKPLVIAKAPLAPSAININLSEESSDSSSGIDAQIFIEQLEKPSTGSKRRILATASKDSGKKAHINSSSKTTSSANVKVCPPKSISTVKAKPQRKLFRDEGKRLGEDTVKGKKDNGKGNKNATSWIDDEYDFDLQ